MCDYQGCVDGVLYDADDCDGWNLRDPAAYKSCPKCRQIDAMDEYLDGHRGDSKIKRPSHIAWHLVMDIRRRLGLCSVTYRQYNRHLEIVHARRNRHWRIRTRWRRHGNLLQPSPFGVLMEMC